MQRKASVRDTIHPPGRPGNTKGCQGQQLLERSCIAGESINTTTLGKDLEVSYKTKHSPILAPSSSTLWYLPSNRIAFVLKRFVPECSHQLYSSRSVLVDSSRYNQGFWIKSIIFKYNYNLLCTVHAGQFTLSHLILYGRFIILIL